MSHHSIRLLILTIILSLLATGCVSVSADSPTEPPSEPVAAPTAIPSATPEPTAVLLPTTEPTITPIPTEPVPDAILNGDLPLSEVAYRLPLTIRHLTTNSVTLFFELDRPTSATLFLHSREAVVPPIELDLDPDQNRQRLTIEGLIPDTPYEAVLAINAAEGSYEQPVFLSDAWGPVTFHTPSETGTLRIGIIGDASFGDSTTSSVVNRMADSDLDFVLHVGDVVDETELDVDPFQSYAMKFYTPFAPLLTQMPVYTVIGNHDYDADIRWQDNAFYYYAFPPFPDSLFPGQENREKNQYYAFAYHNIQFVMLDTQVFFGQPGWDEQQAWLNERLADTRFRMTIPVFHVSPFSSSSVHPTDSIPVRDGWTPLFEAANVPLVLSGHYHQYERSLNNGVTYVISSGGSAIVYAPAEEFLPESQVFIRQSHYALLEIDEQAINITALSLEGEILDQYSIPTE